MKKIYIEISDICGLNCSFCHTPKNKRGVMPLDLFARAITEALKFSKTIALHILGDPCKLKNLSDYLTIAKQNDARIELVTSGAYLHKHSFSLLVSPPIKQISISLEAGFDENNKIPNYLENVCEFALFHKQNPQCFLNLRIQDERLLQDKNKLNEIFCAFDLQKEQRIFTRGRIKLWQKAFLVVKKSFIWAGFELEISDSNAESSQNLNFLESSTKNPKILKRNLESKKCHALKEQIGILSNGVVVPCCIDAQGVINLGNLKTQNLKSILNSSRAIAIKEGFKNYKAIESLCQNCTYNLHNLQTQP